MAGETPITLIGNLTDDPELRFTPSGAAVANFTVASTPRTFDRESGQWRDGEAMFLRCALWREPAERAVESLSKGMRVIVTGRLKQRSFEDREGNKRTVVEVDVDEIGPSLRYATARVTKAVRSNGANGPSSRQPARGNDPWASTPAPAGRGGGGWGAGSDEPPF